MHRNFSFISSLPINISPGPISIELDDFLICHFHDAISHFHTPPPSPFLESWLWFYFVVHLIQQEPFVWQLDELYPEEPGGITTEAKVLLLSESFRSKWLKMKARVSSPSSLFAWLLMDHACADPVLTSPAAMSLWTHSGCVLHRRYYFIVPLLTFWLLDSSCYFSASCSPLKLILPWDKSGLL